MFRGSFYVPNHHIPRNKRSMISVDIILSNSKNRKKAKKNIVELTYYCLILHSALLSLDRVHPRPFAADSYKTDSKISTSHHQSRPHQLGPGLIVNKSTSTSFKPSVASGCRSRRSIRAHERTYESYRIHGPILGHHD